MAKKDELSNPEMKDKLNSINIMRRMGMMSPEEGRSVMKEINCRAAKRGFIYHNCAIFRFLRKGFKTAESNKRVLVCRKSGLYEFACALINANGPESSLLWLSAGRHHNQGRTVFS